MTTHHGFQFPPEQKALRDRARRLAWRSVVLMSVSTVVVYVATGRSQTMKTAWMTDVLSMLPSIALIVALRYELRPANARFPFGHYRATSVSFLVTASALLMMGVWLFTEAALKLGRGERPPIGLAVVFGHPVWSGWTMIAALAYSMVTGILLGRVKTPVAEKLHSKSLGAESQMNRSEWMSEGAGIIGIAVVGLGFWWGDAGAAALISLDIIKEGWLSVRQVVGDLMDEAPTELGRHQLEDLPQRLRGALERMPWIAQASVRLREHGHVITGEVLVVPREASDLTVRIADVPQALEQIDWRLHGLVVMPVERLETTSDGESH